MNTPIELLTQELLEAKAAENAANKRRIEIESKIIDLVGVREEGSTTHTLDSGVKLTITGKVSYSADMDLLMNLCKNLPGDLRPIKTEPKLDETGAKYLRNNEPEIWNIIAAAITIKPAKPSVTIKV